MAGGSTITVLQENTTELRTDFLFDKSIRYIFAQYIHTSLGRTNQKLYQHSTHLKDANKISFTLGRDRKTLAEEIRRILPDL